jgi:Ergosterol biosynthesis ERG4/ERG24 family
MTKSTSELSPRTTHYEFGGPLGALFVTLSVPITTYALYYTCSETSGGCPPPLWSLPTSFSQAVTSLDWWKSLWDTQAFLIYIAWWAFCVVAWFVLPGDWVEGTTMRNGRKLKYKINGMYYFYHVVYSAYSACFSLLHIPPRSWSCFRHNHSLWPFIFHFHLRTLDRSRNFLRGVCDSSSSSCVFCLVPGREAPRPRW